MNRQRAKISHGAGMPPVGPLLKKLRLSASPPLSIRQAAEKLGMGHSSYNFYENPNTFKKPHLPIDFARKVAALFAQYQIDPAEVMKLAGLREAEAEPDIRAIEAARPQVHFVSFPVALPSEAALADMFETLLAMVPGDATRAEAARILAQRLPSGFAAIGPFALDPGIAHATGAATLQSPATDHHATAPPSHT